MITNSFGIMTQEDEATITDDRTHTSPDSPRIILLSWIGTISWTAPEFCTRVQPCVGILVPESIDGGDLVRLQWFVEKVKPRELPLETTQSRLDPEMSIPTILRWTRRNPRIHEGEHRLQPSVEIQLDDIPDRGLTRGMTHFRFVTPEPLRRRNRRRGRRVWTRTTPTAAAGMSLRPPPAEDGTLLLTT